MRSKFRIARELIRCMSKTGLPRDSFYKVFKRSKLESYESYYCCNYNADDTIMSQICTCLSCRDKCKIVTWSDHFIKEEQHAFLKDLNYELINLPWDCSQVYLCSTLGSSLWVRGWLMWALKSWTKWPTFHIQSFWNAFSWMKTFVFWFEFHWSLTPHVQQALNQHRLRQWLGTKHVTSHYPSRWWPS